MVWDSAVITQAPAEGLCILTDHRQVLLGFSEARSLCILVNVRDGAPENCWIAGLLHISIVIV